MGFIRAMHLTVLYCVHLPFFLLRNRLKGAGWLFAFAVLTSYSRIYLGVHYPFDILMGAFVGMALGMGGYLIVRRTKLVPVDSSQ